VIFPSWLYHWVHPYAGRTPRIAVSFNATLAAPAPFTARTEDLVASNEMAASTAAMSAIQ
jgi:Putative 2OG-Fe(II) oxygenase